MTISTAGFCRRAVADLRATHHQTGFVSAVARLPQGFVNGGAVVAVDILNDVPAARSCPPSAVFSEPAVCVSVNGNLVLIVDDDELAQSPLPGQRHGFV